MKEPERVILNNVFNSIPVKSERYRMRAGIACFKFVFHKAFPFTN